MSSPRSHRRQDDAVGVTDRRALIAEARRYLLTHGWPRLQSSLILAGAGIAAFLTSVAALSAGLDSMALRYALAAVAGYAAFLVLVRVWIAWHHGSVFDGTVDGLVPDPSLPRGTQTGVEMLFQGGQSGGGGGGASFDGLALHAVPPPPGPAGSGVVESTTSWLEGAADEDGAFIVLAAACAVAGVVAIGYVVYAAPVLLAEVALDAALLGTLYRRLRKDDARHWSRGLIRGTWLAAVIVVLSAAGAGYFAQRAVPEATSIGGVVRGLEP